MSRYSNNSHTSPEQDKAFQERESVEAFLARGGKIQTLKKTASVKNKVRETKMSIDAQALFDRAVGTKDEAEVIKFLKSQGFEIN